MNLALIINSIKKASSSVIIVKAQFVTWCQELKVSRRQKEKIMASEQITMSETIAKAVAEATRVAIQAMAATVAERPQSMAGPKICRPAMKQPTFDWETEDKYSKCKDIQARGKQYFIHI